jgi:hypothetical protein
MKIIPGHIYRPKRGLFSDCLYLGVESNELTFLINMKTYCFWESDGTKETDKFEDLGMPYDIKVVFQQTKTIDISVKDLTLRKEE